MSDRHEELEALRDLVASAGWLRFRQRAETQYSPTMFGHRVLQLVGEDERGDFGARVLRLKQEMDAVQTLINWPLTRIQQLEGR